MFWYINVHKSFIDLRRNVFLKRLEQMRTWLTSSHLNLPRQCLRPVRVCAEGVPAGLGKELKVCRPVLHSSAPSAVLPGFPESPSTENTLEELRSIFCGLSLNSENIFWALETAWIVVTVTSLSFIENWRATTLLSPVHALTNCHPYILTL